MLAFLLHISTFKQPTTSAATTTNTKRKAAKTDVNAEDANQTLNKTSLPETGKKGFLRDRITKRKEAETNEFGEEEEGNKTVNELDELATEDISEFSLYRESYLLTVTENLSPEAQATAANDDSFDITQMTNGQFESFAEVIPSFFNNLNRFLNIFPILLNVGSARESRYQPNYTAPTQADCVHSNI